MSLRHPARINAARAGLAAVPQCWLMLDARLGERMLDAVAALPDGSAIIIRPHAMLPQQLRDGNLLAIRDLADDRGHILLGSGDLRDSFTGVHLSGAHALHRPDAALVTMPVHNVRDAVWARRLAVDAVLISPVFATNSHGGASGIGLQRFATLARISNRPAIALGGMTAARFPLARRYGAVGWAAIDAWMD